MNLSNPLESLLPGNDANALLALSRVGRLSGRQVARVTGSTSPNATRDALLRLTATGLVTAEPTASATFFEVNRDHLLWQAIEAVLGAPSQLDARIADLHATAAPADTSVLLYGSTAETRSTSASDVDLLVVFSDVAQLEERDAFSDQLAQSVTRWTGNTAEIYDLTASQLRDLVVAEDSLVASWRLKARLIAGRTPDLTRAGAA